MTKYPRLSSLTNSITENKADNTLTFLVAGKQLTRKIKSEAFSNWSVDSVRVNNQRYLIDTRIEYHTVN
ncbi:MAG: hypothetical protein [Caudoviricetes sp.]|nr:MAG: hypothetical protein [Caudoviricetes sp.]